MMQWDGIATALQGEEEGVGIPLVATFLLVRMLHTSCATIYIYYYFVDTCCMFG